MKYHLLAALIAAPILIAAPATAHERHMGGPGGGDERFKEADLNGDGVITRAEFVQHHNDKFKEMDANGDGFVTLDEAIAMAKSKIPDDAKWHPDGKFAEGMVMRMDYDGDGKVSAEEFQVAGDRMFKDMDANGDGKVTLIEAKAAMHDKMWHHGDRGDRGHRGR